MKILIAPLNWGLGHAARCIPIIRRHLAAGDEVVLGGDGDSLLLLRKHFPQLRVLPLAPLNLKYSAHKRQVFAMFRALPRLLLFSILDHRLLKRAIRNEHFDLVISDNRFGLFCRHTQCVYITHQLHILLPHPYQWLDAIPTRMHACICNRFSEVWVPDTCNPKHNFCGVLGHNFSSAYRVPIRYIGILSRFSDYPEQSDIATPRYEVVALLSGLEPQRTLLEQSVIRQYADSSDKVLIVQGLVNRPATPITYRNITLVPHLADAPLAAALRTAKHIIARSGYSTIMDFQALGILSHADFVPTPGQPEQMYLARHIRSYIEDMPANP